MSWQDLGVIFAVNNLSNWAASHCYVPTAIQLHDRIRVYASFWDQNKYGRLGYVDVAIDDPTEVIGYSPAPILEDSKIGLFDCDGVTPLSLVVNSNEDIRLYYAGWQKFDLPNKRYTLYTGLATSDNNATVFKRHTQNAIIGPRNHDDLVRTAGVVRNDDGLWRTWFASYNKTVAINNKLTPCYNLNTMSSADGIHWNNDEKTVFEVVDNAIMGYGRSAIWQDKNTYHGLFSARSWDAKYYNMLYSTSQDGITWQPLSSDGMAFTVKHTCDNQTEVCFPSIIRQENRTLMFYNGNDFGKEGLRLAIWTP